MFRDHSCIPSVFVTALAEVAYSRGTIALEGCDIAAVKAFERYEIFAVLGI